MLVSFSKMVNHLWINQIHYTEIIISIPDHSIKLENCDGWYPRIILNDMSLSPNVVRESNERIRNHISSIDPFAHLFRNCRFEYDHQRQPFPLRAYCPKKSADWRQATQLMKWLLVGGIGIFTHSTITSVVKRADEMPLWVFTFNISGQTTDSTTIDHYLASRFQRFITSNHETDHIYI